MWWDYSYGVFSVASAFFSVFFSLIGIGLYVIMGLGLMKMAQKVGHPYPWLAWIPVANMFLFAHLAGERYKKLGQAFLILLLICIGSVIMAAIFAGLAFLVYGFTGVAVFFTVIAWMAGIASAVLYLILLYHVFYRFKPEHATMYEVLSIFFSFLGPIFILVCSSGTPDQAPPPPPPSSQGPTYTSPSGPQGPTFTPPSGY